MDNLTWAALSRRGLQTVRMRRIVLERPDWAALAPSGGPSLPAPELERLRGLGDPTDEEELAAVHLPLAALIRTRAAGVREGAEAVAGFLGRPLGSRPALLGLVGSVAAGKSTTARLLQALLGGVAAGVELLPTDGFLLPNAELSRRGLLQRKGFPESYDRRELLRVLSELRSGTETVRAPVYSHLRYDVLPGEGQLLISPRLVIVEGLNLLQTTRTGLQAADLLDLTIYLDAAEPDLHRWYVERFLRLRTGAFANPSSYFRRYADLDDTAARATAGELWRQINAVNLAQNILPTRERADIVIALDSRHRMRTVSLRLP